MRPISGLIAFGLMAGAALTTSPALAENIVVNPGFEDNLNGWTYSNFVVDTRSHSGSLAAYTGCGGHDCVSTLNTGAFIDQVLNTVAGARYDLSIYVGQTNGPTAEYSVFWNGALLDDVLNPASNPHPFTLTPDGYVLFRYTNLLATGGKTDLQIHGREDPQGGTLFDDVSVGGSAAAAVPEPASWMMMITGFGVIGAMMRRNTRMAASLA